MKVVISSIAQLELSKIWDRNALERGSQHADRYLEFLRKSISDLGKKYRKGKPVATRPRYRYLLMQRQSGGHGHIAIFEVVNDQVNVLHVYHTAQDWQARFSDKP